jgi:hypothetical protein
MLVPSLSSKGFPDLAQIVADTAPYLTDVAMISSYDVHYDLIPTNWSPNLLFMDSGGYEARYESDLSELHYHDRPVREWTRQLYFQTLTDLKTTSPLVAISFDEVKNNVRPKDQVASAKELATAFPGATVDFLVKPYDGNRVQTGDVRAIVADLAPFDILGFTEKELGCSLSERLHMVVQTRRLLAEVGLETPIHVFGCLDPASVTLFFLCGADIFDGLTWLRLAFHDSLAIYRNNWAVLADCQNVPDDELRLWSYLRNLSALDRLRARLTAYAGTFDGDALEQDIGLIEKTLNHVGVTLEQLRS